MADGERRGAAPRRRSVVSPAAIAAVLALAAVVAVASHGTSVWVVRPGGADRGAVLLRLAVIWSVCLPLIGFLITLAHRRAVAGRPDLPSWRVSALRALPAATAGLAVVSLLAISMMDLTPRDRPGDPSHEMSDTDRRGLLFGILDWRSPPVRAGRGEADLPGGGPGGPLATGRFPILVTVLLGLGAVLAIVIVREWVLRRPPPIVEPDHPVPDAVAVRGAVLGTIDAMLADSDPATAIRGAYARLLDGLAESGAGRRAFEAPVEHMRRVLETLHVRREPLGELVALFELARFSTHTLAASHRDRAIDALRAVAADLGVEPALPAGTGAGSAGPGSAG